MCYLLKTEPNTYSFEDLERDVETLWDGISNPMALKNLREMKRGDKLVIYHTGEERRAVGTASVTSADVSDPKNPKVHIRKGHSLSQPKSLTDIKASPLFNGSPLVKQGRLSVVPLTEKQYEWILGDR
jgi:predicted RNA-binding protein with PUA-like domain